MTPFSHWFPQQQVLYGPGAAAGLAEHCARLGIARPIVVCSPRARADASFQAMVAGLPAATVVWDGVRLHAPVDAAIAGANAARTHGADGIIAFGGGSASDLAKGIAFVLAEGDDFEACALRREPGAAAPRAATAPKLPIIALPTTLSGAEVTPGFSLTRADAYKLIFRDAALAARLVVLDPRLIENAPTRMLFGSGMNAVAHCCEALYSRARTPVSTLFALDGLARLWRGLAHRLDGTDSADDLLLGAYFAAAAIVNARTALHHAICHKLAPLAGISHGEANAAMLAHVLGFNLVHCPVETLDMARALGAGEAAGNHDDRVAAVVATLTGLVERAGLPTRLRAFGLQRDQLGLLAERVFAEPGLAFNPHRIVEAAEIRELLERSW